LEGDEFCAHTPTLLASNKIKSQLRIETILSRFRVAQQQVA
jgi:hypothetical protein